MRIAERSASVKRYRGRGAAQSLWIARFTRLMPPAAHGKTRPAHARMMEDKRLATAVQFGIGAFAAAVIALGGAQAQSAKKPPYWASLAKGEALMRVGPSQDYPAKWLYQRRDLPVKVVEVYPGWRKVEDPDGNQGWFHVRLLKDDPTGMVKGGVATMHDGPSGDARLLYRLETGVVGRLSGCAGGWCAFEVNGKSGYVRAASLWGAIEEK